MILVIECACLTMLEEDIESETEEATIRMERLGLLEGDHSLQADLLFVQEHFKEFEEGQTEKPEYATWSEDVVEEEVEGVMKKGYVARYERQCAIVVRERRGIVKTNYKVDFAGIPTRTHIEEIESTKEGAHCDPDYLEECLEYPEEKNSQIAYRLFKIGYPEDFKNQGYLW